MNNRNGLIINYHLALLGRILNYQFPSAVLALGYLIIFKQAASIILFLITFAAIIFSPYLLFVLKRENRMGWIYLFCTIVILPVIIFTVYYLLDSFLLPLLFIPLLLFYFYCFLLRFSVNELRAKNLYLIQKAKREEDLKTFINKSG